MVKQLTYIESREHNPYRNLAIEEHLMFHCGAEECIIYLWQNQRTVVIGRHQNPWKECRVSALEEDGGYLARRNSGGGTVYHDLGNLNFTFLARKENYAVQRQLEVVRLALDMLGTDVELSGRNDILISGRKVSGNAFYEQGNFCCHHGTIMLNVDVAALSRYLTVSRKKLDAKGVASVNARVKNLKEWIPDLTLESVKKTLRSAAERVYGLESFIVPVEELDTGELTERERRFSSWEWKYGRTFHFQHELSHYFSWGELNLRLQVRKGIVADAAVHSDSLWFVLLDEIPAQLRGSRYERGELCAALERCPTDNKQETSMKTDIINWLRITEL